MIRTPKRTFLCFLASFALIIGLSGCSADTLSGPDLGSVIEEVEANADGTGGDGGSGSCVCNGGSPNEPPPPLPNTGGN